MAIADDQAPHTIIQEEVCYQTSEGSQKWVLDSGCSHHMTGSRDSPRIASPSHWLR
ncbi:hypothetical protein LINGRAHAP2_LOCUS1898 [Linum grandiflorum]